MGFPHSIVDDRAWHRSGGAVGRLVRRALLLALVVGLIGVMAPARSDVAAAGGGVVATDLLNLRAEPGTWAVIVTQLPYGEWVDLLSEPTADGWYQVGYGGLTGWVYGGYLSIGGSAGWAPWPEPTAEAALGGAGTVATAWVSTDGVNVRSAPEGSAGVVDTIPQGSAVTVVGGEVGGYLPIEHWSGQGWVASEVVSYSGPTGPERWIDINRSNSMVTLYEGEQAIAAYWGSLGFDPSDAGFFATAVGSYRVYEKYGALSWTTWGRAWVRHWVAFDPARLNGFHSFSMDASGALIPGGDGPTGGCIAMDPAAVEHLFSFASVGTRVEVHW